MKMLPTKSALSIASDNTVKVSVQINMLTVKNTWQISVLTEIVMSEPTEKVKNIQNNESPLKLSN